MKRSELVVTVFQVPLDAAMLWLAFSMAYNLRNAGFVFDLSIPGRLGHVVRYGEGGSIMPYAQYLHYLGYVIPAFILIFAITGLYAIRTSLPWSKRIASIAISISAGFGFLLLLFLLSNTFFLPRAAVMYAWGLSLVAVVGGRLCLRVAQRLLRRQGHGIVHLVVVGGEEPAQKLLRYLAKGPYALYRLRARFDAEPVEQLLPALDGVDMDELIIAGHKYGAEDLVAIRNFCLEKQISFSFVPALFSALPSTTFKVRAEIGLPAVEVLPTPLEGWGRVQKRLFDLIAATLAIILGSPLFVLIAVWLKITSPGPLIYRHKRIGKNRQPIYVWKFRTMYQEYCTGNGYNGDAAFAKLLKSRPDLAAEWEEQHKLKNDPRVSPPGKFLRATSLDELPQFFNILQGALSLVGPRPIVEEEVGKYGETARILFSVRPGLTGLWQVSGRSDVSFAERVALDADYIEHWSLWRDIKIAFQTIRVFLPGRKKGAY